MKDVFGLREVTQVCLGDASSEGTKVFPLELRHLRALTATVPDSMQAHPQSLSPGTKGETRCLKPSRRKGQP